MSAIETYNGSIYSCTVDIDCPGVSVCFFINKSNTTQGYCSCNIEQGSKGLLCDQISMSGYARIIGYFVDLAFTIFVILVIFCLLILLMKTKRIAFFDVRITSLLMCGISLLFLCCYISVGLYWGLHPILPHEDDKLTGKKRKPFSELRNFSLGIFIFFYITAALNISILWLEVAIASKRFRRIEAPQLSKNYRYILFVVDFIIAITIGLTNWFASSIASTVAAFFCVLVLVLFVDCLFELSHDCYFISSQILECT